MLSPEHASHTHSHTLVSATGGSHFARARGGGRAHAPPRLRFWRLRQVKKALRAAALNVQRSKMPKHNKHEDGGSEDGAAVEKKQGKKEKKEKRERSRSSSPQREESAPEASEGGQMLDCQDCQQKWEFTADEKAFFEEKGFSIPIRCGPCRKIRKQQKEGGGGGGGGGRGGRGGGGGGGDRGSGCFNCGEEGHR